ncbi:hypothetical protein C3Y87_18870 [Carbonactinospora thermoautotrophica]|uniref:SURF1 family protein n=1 Tax=Carbonactinospora thermoautotrophica TaxID=1469144 RepID=UPI00226D4D96|nr:SURF1 family protein [Carbonactinospora thermoautotrophica]MCX9193423.1 hypothetical protein [Carbonactinospora thermoautotrophica]
MVRLLLAPRFLVVHVTAILVLVAFILLGFWQMGRFQESKQPDPGRAGQARQQAPVPLGQVVGPEDRLPAEAVGRLVTAHGVFDREHQLLVADREHRGVTGFLVLTPLRLADGAAIPVVRGWVPRAEDPATAVPTGSVTVTGWLQRSEPAEDVRPRQGSLPEGQVAAISTAELANLLPYRQLYDGYLLLKEQQPPAQVAPQTLDAPPALPVRQKWKAPFSNFAYALQWWAFALFAVFMWYRVVRDRLAQERAAAADPPVGDRTPAG